MRLVTKQVAVRVGFHVRRSMSVRALTVGDGRQERLMGQARQGDPLQHLPKTPGRSGSAVHKATRLTATRLRGVCHDLVIARRSEYLGGVTAGHVSLFYHLIFHRFLGLQLSQRCPM